MHTQPRSASSPEDRSVALDADCTTQDMYGWYLDCWVSFLLEGGQTVSGWLAHVTKFAVVLHTPGDEKGIPEEPGGTLILPHTAIRAFFIDTTDAGKSPMPWGPKGIH